MVEAQKGSMQTCRCTEWVFMWASLQQLIEQWSRLGCPELVAGSGKQVIVIVMATSVHGNLSRMGHVIMW